MEEEGNAAGYIGRYGHNKNLDYCAEQGRRETVTAGLNALISRGFSTNEVEPRLVYERITNIDTYIARSREILVELVSKISG